ncbi:hypothetical protein RE628_16365 [Paenibacillus sp. D2_2]|uniref:hypothetical protein n=1 Tax=Paenibacillus sp. D2_2 TaxID=3073092 RepID=UPI002815AF3A|nr:hypothetical protein [Paenibacillus sp. D2_2]WMT39080.1 hypothetical protein RE628_16365 [Paenibacillus sp. D2_2]
MGSFYGDDDIRDLRERVERLERELEQYRGRPARSSNYFKWFLTGFLIVFGVMILLGITQFVLAAIF